MLLRMLRGIMFGRRDAELKQRDSATARDKANEFMTRGDPRSAIAELRRHLEKVPDDVLAINTLGCRLADIGDEPAASKCFELAYSLDDSFLPAIVNHAKFLKDMRRSDESLRVLHEAKSIDPDYYQTDTIYAGIVQTRGDVRTSRHYALRAWLADFDSLRYANSYLTYSAYDDISETTLAAEHKFWGETLIPRVIETSASGADLSEYETPPAKSPEKIRIGYWSPDFRNHSVRYFFRPLLDNHDRDRFEVFLYHDHPSSDEQTESMRKNADRFFRVSNCPDQMLVELLKSHQLDILVELAGHTSANRLPLLRERFAILQLSGLGYPPTTGLSTVDAKLLDIYTQGEDSDRYYTERPLVLPASFWCFNPYTDAAIAPEPPAVKNGYVTFACVGNIAKISDRIVQCWKKILDRVPTGKLVLRSISFEENVVTELYRQKLLDAGLPPDRLTLLQPEAGAAYFASYNEIDIILDTFPFSGGTTTCFATYMGVPVVSLAGKSLLSRMGKSVLSNLGMSDWAVDTEDRYVDRAVAASNDVELLFRVRAEVRSRFQESALGNGKLFASAFENACVKLLKEKQVGTWSYSSNVPDLPPEELVKRAYLTLNTRQEAAAQRIVDYCLRSYPTFGPAHILFTQRLTSEGRFADAASHLLERLDGFDSNSHVATFVNVARNFILCGHYLSARQAVDNALSRDPSDPIEACQLKLLNSVLLALEIDDRQSRTHSPASGPQSISVYIVSNEHEFPGIVDRFRATLVQSNDIDARFIHCPEQGKAARLRSAIYDTKADVAVWLNKNVSLCNPTFLTDVAAGLEHADIIGVSGSRVFDRLNWKRCEFATKAGSYLAPSGEKDGYFDLVVVGSQSKVLVPEMAVLDGGLLAFAPAKLRVCKEFDLDPFLESAATLMEEYLAYQCNLVGLRVAVHQTLGVAVDWRTRLFDEHLAEARWHLAQKLSFDPFKDRLDNRVLISAPCSATKIGVAAQRIYFGEEKSPAMDMVHMSRRVSQ